MEIRPVRPEDNEGLIQLSLSCPMLGDVSVCFDRGPDYFAFYNQFGPCRIDPSVEPGDGAGGDGWTAVCACEGSRIVGVLAAMTRSVLYEQNLIRIVFLGDARVAPEFQHQGVMKKLMSFYRETWGDTPTDLIVTHIVRGNHRAEKAILEGLKDISTGVHVGDFSMTHVAMYYPYRSAAIQIERATDRDIPEVADLLSAFYADYHFSPLFTQESFKAMLSRAPGYTMEDVRVVREEGKVQALIGLWDQKKVRRIIATKIPRRLKWGIQLAKVIHLVMQSPKPPKEGVPQDSLFIKHLAHRPGKQDLLSAMMKKIANEVRASGDYQYIWGAFYDSDPVRSIFDSMHVTEIPSGQYCTPGNTGWFQNPHDIESKPCYADYSMI